MKGFESFSFSQFAEDVEPEKFLILLDLRSQRQRQPNFGPFRKRKSFGGDADDGVDLFIQDQMSSDCGRIFCKARAPERIADDHRVILPGLVILFGQHAPLLRACSELFEEAAGDAGDAQHFWLIASGESSVRLPVC